MKQRNLFKSLTLVCVFLTIALNGIQWIWENSPAASAIFAVLAIVFGIFWVRSQRFLKEK